MQHVNFTFCKIIQMSWYHSEIFCTVLIISFPIIQSYIRTNTNNWRLHRTLWGPLKDPHQDWKRCFKQLRISFWLFWDAWNPELHSSLIIFFSSSFSVSLFFWVIWKSCTWDNITTPVPALLLRVWAQIGRGGRSWDLWPAGPGDGWLWKRSHISLVCRNQLLAALQTSSSSSWFLDIEHFKHGLQCSVPKQVHAWYIQSGCITQKSFHPTIPDGSMWCKFGRKASLLLLTFD